MTDIKIGNSIIGPNQPTYIIAEIGINHNGDFGMAKKLIDAAVDAKVNAVKFQKRDLSSLYTEDVLTNTNKYEQHFQYMIPILKDVELEEDQMAQLQAYCMNNGIEFICTPFDITSADFLERLDVNAYKIASPDLTNMHLLSHVAEFGKPVILSTGMSYLEEVEVAVGFLKKKRVPFALLHCRSVYPVWPREVNLKMIDRLKSFGCPVGYSGHGIGITIPLVAASMGACIVEKHITMDKKMSGPDHKISLEPYELKRLVRDIRVADQAMGKQKRFLLRGEIINRELFGKSLLAAFDISKGTTITREMIRVQGPGKGLSPQNMEKLIGVSAVRDLKAGDFFFDEDLGVSNGFDITNNFKSNWGLICRFSDFHRMMAYNPKVIEIHLAEKDFEFDFTLSGMNSQELIIHVPEYLGDRLMDLCSCDETIRRNSVLLVERSIDLARKLAPHFSGAPKVVAHPGAMSLLEKLPPDRLQSAMKQSLSEIDTTDIILLLENLPPYPWYFGGQWKGNLFLDAEEIRAFCEMTSMNICFDLSHAALYCNAKNKDLFAYAEILKPYIRHIHFADAYGLDGEGVQIGEGDIDFDRVMPLFSDYRDSWVPEIWRGHLQNGKEFLKAMRLLSRYSL